VQPDQRSYVVETRQGQTMRGRLLNQDAFSVQLLTEDDALRSFQKAELVRSGFVPSPMPSIRGVWDDQQVADVLRYLVSLRGVARP
jgi:hypothetical protein